MAIAVATGMDRYAFSYCSRCRKAHAGYKGLLMHGASRAALAASMDASDREYAAQRAARRARKADGR